MRSSDAVMAALIEVKITEVGRREIVDVLKECAGKIIVHPGERMTNYWTCGL